MSKPVKHKTLADMSLPAEERARGRRPGVISTPPAQMSRAAGSRASRERRDGERKLEIERRLHAEAARRAEVAAEIWALDDEQFAARILARVPEDARPAMEILLRDAAGYRRQEADDEL